MPGLETSYGNAGIIQREAVQPYAFPRDIATLLRVATGRSNDAHYHLNALWQLWPRLFAYWRSSAPSWTINGQTRSAGASVVSATRRRTQGLLRRRRGRASGKGAG